MAKFIKYSLIILVVIFLATVVLPIAVGVFLGGLIAYAGMKLFVGNESIVIKIVAVFIILTGASIMLSAIPALPLLAVAIAGYVLYKWYENKKEVTSSGSPFEQFNQEWKNITK